MSKFSKLIGLILLFNGLLLGFALIIVVLPIFGLIFWQLGDGFMLESFYPVSLEYASSRTGGRDDLDGQGHRVEDDGQISFGFGILLLFLQNVASDGKGITTRISRGHGSHGR